MINGENGMEMQKRISAPGKIELVKRVSRTPVRSLAYVNHWRDGDDAATAMATNDDNEEAFSHGSREQRNHEST